MKNYFIEYILSFVGLVAGVVSAFFKLKSDTKSNFVMIQNIEKKIVNLEQDYKAAYNQLDNKISLMDTEIKQISRDTAEIKGYLRNIIKKND